MKTTTCILMAAAALGAVGCSDGGASEPDAADDDTGAVTVLDKARTGGDPPSDSVPTTTTPEGEPVAAQSGPALARRDGQINGEPVTLEIVELRRSGGTAALNIRLSMPTGTGDVEEGPDIEDTFDDGTGELDAAGGNDQNSVDGITLIDAKNAKRHLVGRDANGRCVCDGNLWVEGPTPAAPMTLSATFAAPPADVEAVDVEIPRYGTFKDVPLQ